MKKTVFSICSILTVVALIIMSCEKKDDPGMKKVYYNTQPGYSTGGNPNPTGVATSGGSAVSSGTASSGTASSSSGTSSSGTSGSTCTTTQTSNSQNGTSPMANGGVGMGGTWEVTHNSSVGTVVITFATAGNPPSGTYTIVNATPGPGQCSFSDFGTMASGGTVNVTSPATGATNGKLTYSNVVTGIYTTSGTACY